MWPSAHRQEPEHCRARVLRLPGPAVSRVGDVQPAWACGSGRHLPVSCPAGHAVPCVARLVQTAWNCVRNPDSQPLTLAIDRGESECGSPRESLESRVVAIRGDPFATGLDGQSRKPGVLRHVSRGLGIPAQGLEYRPVTFAGHNHRREGLSEDNATKLESVIQGAGTCKNPPMGTDADDASEHLRCDAVSRWPIDRRFQPCLVSRMILGVRTKGVDQYIDVAQDQSRCSIRSSRPALSLKSTPGRTPPPAWHSGSDTAACCGRFSGRRSASRSPCSMSDVSVMPRRAASCRARSMSAASRRTVVLICQSIYYVCLYVKRHFGAKFQKL